MPTITAIQLHFQEAEIPPKYEDIPLIDNEEMTKTEEKEPIKEKSPESFETQKTMEGDKVGLFSLDIKGAHMILHPQLNWTIIIRKCSKS